MFLARLRHYVELIQRVNSARRAKYSAHIYYKSKSEITKTVTIKNWSYTLQPNYNDSTLWYYVKGLYLAVFGYSTQHYCVSQIYKSLLTKARSNTQT